MFCDISLELEKGRIAAITGPSGSGKSTLGCCLAGVIPHLLEGEYKGAVEIAGRPGIVFQDPDTQVFFPAVEDELAFAPENLCLTPEETGKRIAETLQKLGIPHLADADPKLLSGGQKQLIALGGVLTLAPDLLILDETLSQLDRESKDRIKQHLLELKAKGVSIILIEHQSNNYDIADEIWLLEEGKLLTLYKDREVDALD
ncbi:hypothetical protein MASR2M70_09360 [Bacillota bacterium]